ncbi:hypothetical protein MATL_G00192610 [Megalops atlanticus]|uniref:Uncharacterized protein n=1 Tax=Megalops atlanticus TaxID=7932 RepID=A0A9D3PMT9_MEGAT|nr:hypothetical protein MATL_G00192610 [Megalops atlanticus]
MPSTKLLLLVVSCALIKGEVIATIMYGTIGGSHEFSGLVCENPSYVEWTYKRDASRPMPVANYHRLPTDTEPEIYDHFKDRITFHRHNWSFALHRLTSSDGGTYTVKCDTITQESFNLNVTEALPEQGNEPSAPFISGFSWKNAVAALLGIAAVLNVPSAPCHLAVHCGHANTGLLRYLDFSDIVSPLSVIMGLSIWIHKDPSGLLPYLALTLVASLLSLLINLKFIQRGDRRRDLDAQLEERGAAKCPEEVERSSLAGSERLTALCDTVIGSPGIHILRVIHYLSVVCAISLFCYWERFFLPILLGILGVVTVAVLPCVICICLKKNPAR